MKKVEKLTLPNVPPDFLELRYHISEKLDIKDIDQNIQNGCIQPFAASNVFMASVLSARQLTKSEGVKKVVDVCLNVEDGNIEFHPGDTVGVIPQNPDKEVEEILRHLNLLEKADLPVSVTLKPGTLKKKASMPPHIPVKTTLRHIFNTCVDIRAVPKKLFLRVLALYTDDPNERRHLEELCSREGSADYSKDIVDTKCTLVDLLTMFPSCCPPVERLLEHLPRLQARPYSIASSPLKNDRELHIVYSLLEEPSKRGSGLNFGICTGWLDSMTRSIQTVNCAHDPLLEDMKKLSLKNDYLDLKIPLYLRKSSGFTLPNDPTIPLILIGPGTGVAPYIGFLQHRAIEKQKCNESVFGEIWLFFGCRYKEKDFLYRSELEKFIDDGTVCRIFISFSQDEGNNFPRYVQDNIKLHGKEFVKQVFEKNAIIYVCGDAKNMGKDVFEAIITEIQNEKGIEETEARLLLKELQTGGRYLQDIWV